MKDIEKITNIYESYQYTLEKTGDNFAVFSLGAGIYPGVDILISENISLEDYNNIRRAYSDAGYATNKVEFHTIEELEISLFTQFFKPQYSREKLLSHYREYTDGVMKPYIQSNGVKPEYKYIEVSYTFEEDFTPMVSSTKLVDKLYNLFDENKSKLIIVEAPAGFGKTSTAYELVARLCSDSSIRRPFFMELAKDRSATTFRYLLLSQIEKNFQTQLKNDIVIKNIKSGRIPLIIDGFDELLSKDLDCGQGKVHFEEVETMLSTIADLLTDKTKIILTTRKTAIFSGDRFIEWYFSQQEKGNNFSIARIQLMDPTPNDWLSKEQIEMLPDNISRINNPVLLSYLRYTPKEKFISFTNPDILVKSYFDFLFKREIDRQSLPFKAIEQRYILGNLAAYFAACDITADNRTDVLDAILTLSYSMIEDACSTDRDDRSLANTLANHALLDRHASGKVGFINDYVFGSLLGWSFLDKKEGVELIETLSTRTADKLIEACSVWAKDNRIELAKALYELKSLPLVVELGIDRFLFGKIIHKFNRLNLADEEFVGLSFDGDGFFDNCTFTKCTFLECVLDFNKISNCTFIACIFQDNEIVGTNETCFFYDGNPCEEEEIIDVTNSYENDSKEDFIELDKRILGLFYRKGSLNTRINRISTITDLLNEDYERKVILKRIERLVKNDYIITNGDNAWIRKAGSDYYNTLK
ncbi:NACHT domain-containing protein [Bacteroides acidifaciens]|uniref:NACHT domain-containing protein n=1 Tax=Bacteroides acidifaciens TaxID=85831 RepID=UPI0026021B95|nr:NACHT domain-containing protein [Bacteroides acidifaciens]